jgi:hypothetical protein
MSAFGKRFEVMSILLMGEFSDTFVYEPRREVRNSVSEPDPTRVGGEVKMVVQKPGTILGMGWALSGQMHSRSSSDIKIWFRAQGLLTDVRRFDRFAFNGANSDPARPIRFEIADGPIPMGFDWWRTGAVEIPWLNDDGSLPNVPVEQGPPVSLGTPDPPPVSGDVLRNSSTVLPWD